MTGGLEAALGRKEQINRHRKVDGTVEAHMIAIACSEAPEGRERWTLQLIADELVRLGVVESISPTAVMNTLKKTNLNHGKRRNGVFQKLEQNLQLEWKMCWIYISVCTCPVICLDETNKQLLEERRIPVRPGNPELVDYEYRRCGVIDFFVAFEPLACKRIVRVSKSRTAFDFALFIQELVDIHYSHCEKIILVMDNLNIHSIASLYKAFPPQEARRIASRLGSHYTPIHASWLNMAEIEIGILSRQYLSQSIVTFEEMVGQVAAWQLQRNISASTVIWRFDTKDARCKLKSYIQLYASY